MRLSVVGYFSHGILGSSFPVWLAVAALSLEDANGRLVSSLERETRLQASVHDMQAALDAERTAAIASIAAADRKLVGQQVALSVAQQDWRRVETMLTASLEAAQSGLNDTKKLLVEVTEARTKTVVDLAAAKAAIQGCSRGPFGFALLRRAECWRIAIASLAEPVPRHRLLCHVVPLLHSLCLLHHRFSG